jgi:hypothetical protein
MSYGNKEHVVVQVDQGLKAEVETLTSSLAQKVKKDDLVVNVKDYGVKGDGITDDTATIQAVFNLGANRIYFPKGTYLLSAPLQITNYGYNIFGAGINNTILKANAPMEAIFKIHEGASGNSAVGRLTLSDLELNCNNLATDGVFAKNLRYNNVFQRLYITFALRHGINLSDSCWINNINHCRISGSVDSAIFIGGYGNSIHIGNCDLGGGLYGVKVDGTTATSDGIAIMSNTIQGFTNAGVYGTGIVGSLSIIGNYFEDNAATTIELNSDVKAPLISGNKIHGKTGVSTYNIINKSRNASIIGNLFYQAVTANIQNVGNAQAFIAGNRIENGSTTLVVGFADSFVIEAVYGMPSKINGKRIGYSGFASAPATGTWAKGDFVYNSDPDASEYMGWVCTVAGTPGTWKGFGAIQA